MKPFTSESFKQKKFNEARANCPEFSANELFWDEDTKQWLPKREGVTRLASQENPTPRPPCQFAKGDKVFHANYGEGIIVSEPEPAWRNTYAMDVFFLNNRVRPGFERLGRGIKRLKAGALKKA